LLPAQVLSGRDQPHGSEDHAEHREHHHDHHGPLASAEVIEHERTVSASRST